jgi:hypothetical protein
MLLYKIGYYISYPIYVIFGKFHMRAEKNPKTSIKLKDQETSTKAKNYMEYICFY